MTVIAEIADPHEQLPPQLRTPDIACHNQTDLMYSTDRYDQAAAVAICRTCTARPACADWALRRPEPYGTWGGLTEHTRATLLKRAHNRQLVTASRLGSSSRHPTSAA